MYINEKKNCKAIRFRVKLVKLNKKIIENGKYINKRINGRDEKRRRQPKTKHAKVKCTERPRQHPSLL